MQKVVTTQNAEEKKKLEDFVTAGVEVKSRTEIPAGVFTIAFSPDGQTVAAAGADGLVRLINPADGSIVSQFPAIEVSQEMETMMARNQDGLVTSGSLESLAGEESLPSGTTLKSLEVSPKSIVLSGPLRYGQILVTGILNTGDRIDVTRMAELSVEGVAAAVSKLGRVTPLADGAATLKISFQGQSTTIPIQVSEIANPQPVSFIRDVNPVLSRLGCNQGTCHGAKDGKHGFKLSLRGYDPIYDVRSFTDDVKSRRTNVASPDDSLMLLKASGVVPHVGGQLTLPGETYYETIRAWIAQGAKLTLDVPRVQSITIEPENPVVQLIGSRQQLRVVATYTDGTTRDVTAEAYVESGNTEVAETNRASVVTAIRRGEAPVLARFEGAYTATTLTVMGDRTGFAWQEPETWNAVDGFVSQKWAADEDPSVRIVHGRRVHPPRLSRSHRFAAVRRRSCGLRPGLPPNAGKAGMN